MPSPRTWLYSLVRACKVRQKRMFVPAGAHVVATNLTLSQSTPHPPFPRPSAEDMENYNPPEIDSDQLVSARIDVRKFSQFLYSSQINAQNVVCSM